MKWAITYLLRQPLTNFLTRKYHSDKSYFCGVTFSIIRSTKLSCLDCSSADVLALKMTGNKSSVFENIFLNHRAKLLVARPIRIFTGLLARALFSKLFIPEVFGLLIPAGFSIFSSSLFNAERLKVVPFQVAIFLVLDQSQRRWHSIKMFRPYSE